MKLRDLCAYLDQELNMAAFSEDISNNGLQVEGDAEVTSAVFAVDASLELFEYAEDAKADFIFVHHGISWGAEPRRFAGVVAKQLSVLFKNDISLYAAHLPLDAAPVFGNNARLAEILKLKNLIPFCRFCGVDVGCVGELSDPQKPDVLAAILKKSIGASECNFYGDSGALYSRIAVVSGEGGSDAIREAALAGADLLVTGEFGHSGYHLARESGVAVLAAGHYATETVGPRAMMEKVRRKFGIKTEFADFPTGL